MLINMLPGSRPMKNTRPLYRVDINILKINFLPKKKFWFSKVFVSRVLVFQGFPRFSFPGFAFPGFGFPGFLFSSVSRVLVSRVLVSRVLFFPVFWFFQRNWVEKNVIFLLPNCHQNKKANCHVFVFKNRQSRSCFFPFLFF